MGYKEYRTMIKHKKWNEFVLTTVPSQKAPVLNWMEEQAFLNVKNEYEKNRMINKARAKRLFLKFLEEEAPFSLTKIKAAVWWNNDNNCIKYIHCYDENGKWMKDFHSDVFEDFLCYYCGEISFDVDDEFIVDVKNKRFTVNDGEYYDFNGDKINES